MINSTDLQEVEISLPGQWTRKDSGELYTFTNDKMKLIDERLFKELTIVKDGRIRSHQYALAIEDDYCGIVVDDEHFIVVSLTKKQDGSAAMQWSSQAGFVIDFDHVD